MKGAPLSFKVFPENEISFNYAPRRHLNSSLQLTSTTDQLLAYKIKTNVPICYVVKPHIGFVNPHSTIEISITMQPSDYTPQTASISDKFLINVVPLPPNTDVAVLSDPARFQQIWDSVPKSLVESSKLKVVLKFDTTSANTSVLDRTTEDPMREHAVDSRPVNPRLSQVNESMAESRDDLGRTSMMQSFAMDHGAGMGISRNVTLEQNILPQFGNEQVLKPSPVPIVAATTGVTKGEDVNKKRESVNVRESVSLREEKDADVKVLLRSFEERMGLLEKRLEKVETEKSALNQRCQELTGKAEEQNRLIVGLSEEKKKLRDELGSIKSNIAKYRGDSYGDVGGIQMWQVLLAVIVALILGAYLRS